MKRIPRKRKYDQFMYWRCGACGKKHCSDRKNRWMMDMCECGEGGVDAEEYYSRFLGKVKVISKEDYHKEE